MDFHIRKATDKDTREITTLIFNIWVNEYAFKISSEDYPDLQNIETYYHNKGGNFLVATLNQDVIGTIACDSLNNDTFVLKRMFVKRDFRGEGIAQSLLDNLLQDFAPGTTFYLSTKEDLALAAKKFYLRNGFEVIEKLTLPEGFPFFYQDDLFMRKII